MNRKEQAVSVIKMAALYLGEKEKEFDLLALYQSTISQAFVAIVYWKRADRWCSFFCNQEKCIESNYIGTTRNSALERSQTIANLLGLECVWAYNEESNHG